MSGVGKLTEACGWSMRPVFAVAALALSGNSVNGKAAPPKSRAREVGSCIPSPLVQPLCVFRDWSRRLHRRECIQLLRQQRVEVQMESGRAASPSLSPAPLSRAQRAHSRLDWQERFARNGRAPGASQVTIKLFGVPQAFARLSRPDSFSGNVTACHAPPLVAPHAGLARGTLSQLAARLPEETNLGRHFAQHVDLFPGFMGHMQERFLQERILCADFCFPNVSCSLPVSLEADGARHVEHHQTGMVVCLACQIEQPATCKIVQSRAVRNGETPQLQSFLNQQMEEIKDVGIDVLCTIPVTNQRSTSV